MRWFKTSRRLNKEQHALSGSHELDYLSKLNRNALEKMSLEERKHVRDLLNEPLPSRAKEEELDDETQKLVGRVHTVRARLRPVLDALQEIPGAPHSLWC